jgi:hypothetical protein
MASAAHPWGHDALAADLARKALDDVSSRVMAPP